MAEESAQRKYIKVYMQAVRAWAGKLPEETCHEVARKAAAHAHRLTAPEQRAVDTWLDGRYPVRTRKPENRGAPTLWDDLPTAS
jgi:hypothetical protein